MSALGHKQTCERNGKRGLEWKGISLRVGRFQASRVFPLDTGEGRHERIMGDQDLRACGWLSWSIIGQVCVSSLLSSTPCFDGDQGLSPVHPIWCNRTKSARRKFAE